MNTIIAMRVEPRPALGMPRCNLVIDGARVIDGSGAIAQNLDVAIDGDRIVDIGDCQHWQSDSRIDASGLVLAPGFIDSHTHDDLAILNSPTIPFKLSQGVTTVIAGNCGISLAPLKNPGQMPAPFPLLGNEEDFQYPTVNAYREKFSRNAPALNLALLAGHSSLRLNCIADKLDQSADSTAIAEMASQLRLALKQGCIGLSTGLDYPPALAASTDEVVELASVLREFEGSVYATHMRDESDQVLEAVQETLTIGTRASVPVVISHHKCAGPKNYGRSLETLALIDKARSEKQTVSLDVYPYTASATSLLSRFVDNAEAVLVAESEPHPECNGKMLDRIVADWDCSFDEACERLYPASAIYFQMDDADLERIMSHPAAMIGSDGIASMQTPHPRLWGTFPRVLGHYAREKKLFSLETAVHKMTGLTAHNFGLKQRGLIAVDYYADLVLFDADRIIDRASFDQPTRNCEGIKSVWVNGQLSWQDQSATGARNGRFLTH